MKMVRILFLLSITVLGINFQNLWAGAESDFWSTGLGFGEVWGRAEQLGFIDTQISKYTKDRLAIIDSTATLEDLAKVYGFKKERAESDSEYKARLAKEMTPAMKANLGKPLYTDAAFKQYLKDRINSSMSRFRNAILESEEVIKKQWSKNVKLLKLADKDIIWNKDHTAVLVVSLVPVGGVYQYGYAKSLNTPTREYVTAGWSGWGLGAPYCWVTFVPQVKKFSREYIKKEKLFEPTAEKSKDRNWYIKDRIKLTDRVNEYLGLIPFSEDYLWSDIRAVEMWVRPQDLFRPCENPDPDASSCAKTSKTVPIEKLAGAVRFDFSHFMKAKKMVTWSTEPFPWTNVGFTYDWGQDAEKTHIGATELAIKPASKVIFQERAKDFPSLEFYCQEETTPATGTVDIKMP